MVCLKLIWTGEGSDVKIAGAFNDWAPAETQTQSDNTRVYQVDIQPGKYTYKWVIDANWLVDKSQPTETDESGNTNNLIVVEEEPTTEESIESKAALDAPAAVKEAEHEPRAASEETSGEGSGDSDSWERVSVGDCADKGSLGDKDGFVIADVDDASTKSKKIINLERIFSWSEGFDSKISSEGESLEDDNYVVFYWDTPDYALLKQGVWCKQIRDTWIIRRLCESKVVTIKSAEEINECLKSVLSTEEPLTELLKSTLTKKIEFEGSLSRWRHGNIIVEKVQEGELKTVTLRTEDCMMEGLKKIYALSGQLALLKLKLI